MVQVGFETAQDGPKMAQVSPKTAKTVPRRPRTASRSHQDAQDRLKTSPRRLLDPLGQGAGPRKQKKTNGFLSVLDMQVFVPIEL